MNRRQFILKSAGFVVFGGLALTGLGQEKPAEEKKYCVIAQRCDGCGRCFRACREGALSVKDGKAVIDPKKCKGCGDCTRFCRRMAIVEVEEKRG
jgi:ferredoxin